MKKSNILIIVLLSLSFLGMIASGFSLKKQFDAIDRNDPYYGFKKSSLETFHYIKMTGNYRGATTVERSEDRRILVQPLPNKDGTPVVKWHISHDTLFLSYHQDGPRGEYSSFLFKRPSNVVITVPSLSGLNAEGIPVLVRGFEGDTLNVKLRGFGMALRENDFQALLADVGEDGQLLVQGGNSFGSAGVVLKDSSRFWPYENAFGSIDLDIDSLSRVDVPGSMLRRIDGH